MRSPLKILALTVILCAGAWILPQKAAAQVSVSLQIFYDELSPYGSWVEYQNYGYVWVPDVDRDFAPYCNDGHWVFTEDGWTWVSNYSWGWAPFHYGRWAYDDYYGWIWVPDNVWGPAWVTWRRSEGYYGWAPLGPGISIEFSFGSGYRVPSERWVFVSYTNFSRPDIDRYYVDRSTNITIINNSTVINNTYVDNSRHTTYVAGPARDDVQKVTGQPIRPVAIRESDKPGQALSNDQLQIFRPQVQTSVSGKKPAPARVASQKEVKPVAERKPGNQRRNESAPPGGKEQSSQPANANPRGQNKIPEATPQPQGAKPTGKPEQPRNVNPHEQNKSPEAAPQPQGDRPERKGRDQQPPTVNPTEKNRGIEAPPPNPAGTRGKDRPPLNVKPSDTGKKELQPAKPKSAPTIKRKGRDTQPPKMNKEKGDTTHPPSPSSVKP